MERDRFARMMTIFEAARQRPPEARRAYVEIACDGDVELASEVTLLLDKDESDSRILDESSLHSGPDRERRDVIPFDDLAGGGG